MWEQEKQLVRVACEPVRLQIILTYTAITKLACTVNTSRYKPP